MNRLIESLHLLAAPPAGQRTALPPFVAFADELALIFDDELRATDLDALLASIRAALAQLDGAWANVREQARDLLRSLGEEPRAPDLFWLTFVG
jgi:hypothetical protein